MAENSSTSRSQTDWWRKRMMMMEVVMMLMMIVIFVMIIIINLWNIVWCYIIGKYIYMLEFSGTPVQHILWTVDDNVATDVCLLTKHHHRRTLNWANVKGKVGKVKKNKIETKYGYRTCQAIFIISFSVALVGTGAARKIIRYKSFITSCYVCGILISHGEKGSAITHDEPSVVFIPARGVYVLLCLRCFFSISDAIFLINDFAAHISHMLFPGFFSLVRFQWISARRRREYKQNM